MILLFLLKQHYAIYYSILEKTNSFKVNIYQIVISLFHNLRSTKLFFKFSFYFENETLKKIGFEIETEPTPRIAWGNNRDFETDWIASQMNDVTKIDWENPTCDQYWLVYHWGGVGIFFDFKNGTYDSFLSYKSNE